MKKVFSLLRCKVLNVHRVGLVFSGKIHCADCEDVVSLEKEEK